MDVTGSTFGANAADWHRTRARTLSKEGRPFVKGLHTRRLSSLVAILSLFFVQVAIAASCSRLHAGWVFVLSATIGAFIAWGFHNFLHDVTHRSVAFTRNRHVRTVLLRLCGLTHPDLSLYLYYRWHHTAHHKNLARHGVKDVVYGHDNDADVLAVSAYYQVRETRDRGPRSGTPGLFRSRPAKVLVGLLPLVDYVSTNMLFTWHGLSFLTKPFRPGWDVSPRRLQAKGSALLHLLLVIAFQAGIWALFGWKAFAYLLLSFLFVKGLLFHPYILFWITIHKTTHHGDQCQPTTSIYGRLTHFLFWGLNNHVEHHDFRGVPSTDLPKLRERFGEHYDSLFSFASLWDAYRQFFASDAAWVYGCQDA